MIVAALPRAQDHASARALAINGAIFSGAAAISTLAAIAFDGQPAAFIPHIASIAILDIAVAGAFIPVASSAKGAKRTTTALIAAVALLLIMPALVPPYAHATRFVVAMGSGVLVMKCVDMYVGSRRSAIDARSAFAFLFASCLVLRNTHPAEMRQEPLIKQLTQSAAGTALLVLAFRFDWTPWPFLLEHSVKFLAFAAAAFPACNALMATARLLGGSAADFSRNSALARTPAEFWRRYNRVVGEFLWHDIARSVGGLHAPVKAVIAAFAFSAVLHEYLLAAAAGRAFGYQTAFFSLQAVAVLATMRLAPRGAAGVAGTALTILFMLLTATLFGANVHAVFPIYSNPLPQWLIW